MKLPDKTDVGGSPHHTLDQCAEGLRQLALTKRTTDEFAASVCHYLSEYRRLAEGKQLLADGTVAMEYDLVWYRGWRYLIDDIGEGVAHAVHPNTPTPVVCLSKCHRTRDASLEAKQ